APLKRTFGYVNAPEKRTSILIIKDLTIYPPGDAEILLSRRRVRGRRGRGRDFGAEENAVVERGCDEMVAGHTDEGDLIAGRPPDPGHGPGVDGIYFIPATRTDEDPFRSRVVAEIVDVAQGKS